MSRVDRLFQLWYPRLVAALSRRLGSRDDAEDVAQDAFIRLLDHEPDNPRAWLFTVAGRLASDTQRAADRRRRLTIDPEPQVAVDEALVHAEHQASVRRILDALPDRDQQLLLLHHDGLRYREIAAQLGVAESSIGSLLTRAHRRFLAAHDTLGRATAESALRISAGDRSRAAPRPRIR